MNDRGPFRISEFAARNLGCALDRALPLAFRFNGQVLHGIAGDTLASSLLANGVRITARSLKFHRPRGIFSCGIEEPNALVQLERGARTVPSSRATLIELYPGLQASSQSGWPNLNVDVGRVIDFTARLWPAGFYNKTFIWPSWHAYEWLIRRMAGFGHAPGEPDPDRYEIRNLHCDTLVIGAGTAGLEAAAAATNLGGRVVLAEQERNLGGRAAWDSAKIDSAPGENWIRATQERLAQCANLKILRRTTALGYYEKDVITLIETAPSGEANSVTARERLWVVRARQTVLATGAIEQPLVFCNNDRPGIMLAGAAQQYLRRYGVALGRRVLIATNNDSAYALARDLTASGVKVIAVTDTRQSVPQAYVDELRKLSVSLFPGTIPVNTAGFGALTRVDVGKLTPDCRQIEQVQRFPCDALAVSGGWNPAVHLYSQAGGKVQYASSSAALQAVGKHPVVSLVGAAAGIVGTDPTANPIGLRISPVGNTARQWVDLRHDVTVSDIELATRENFKSIEHIKRFTTIGMAADQGKTSSLAALQIAAALREIKPEQIGHTTYRPPFVPVTLGALAGRSINDRFAPTRILPLNDWHESHGAMFDNYGAWKRPVAYLRDSESRHAAIMREARVVRTRAGLFDGSPLGKIEIEGPDALEFLDHFYINDLTSLKPGRVRYGLMLRERGSVFDDGTITLISPERILVTTTSGNAGKVLAWLEEWHQCEWLHLRVAISSVTDQWATMTLAGPQSRTILGKLDTDIDLSNAAFPHMGYRQGHLMDYPARIYRVSYTGELSYEIYMPALAGLAVWEALMRAGEPLGIVAYGIEALLLMRLEKGLLHIGSDTDGTTVPDDLGWGEVALKKRSDFIGQRSLYLPEHLRADRLQLVGLRSEANFVVGSHLRVTRSAAPTDGWITSAGRSVLTGEPIALCLLRAGRSRMGETVTVHDMGISHPATVAATPFYDAAGVKMHA